jgi:hypothetical protein
MHNNKNKEETVIKAVLDNNNYPRSTIQQKPLKKNSKQKKKMGHLHFLRARDKNNYKIIQEYQNWNII